MNTNAISFGQLNKEEIAAIEETLRQGYTPEQIRKRLKTDPEFNYMLPSRIENYVGAAAYILQQKPGIGGKRMNKKYTSNCQCRQEIAPGRGHDDIVCAKIFREEIARLREQLAHCHKWLSGIHSHTHSDDYADLYCPFSHDELERLEAFIKTLEASE